MAKSLVTTYILWLFGGWLGLHHFYLRRDRQALLWWMFAGGYFGIGWLRDLWKIPDYVKDANGDEEYMERLIKEMHDKEKPPSSWFRSAGQMIVADAFGYLILAAIPYEHIPSSLWPICAIFVPLAVAIGVHTVGNIGRHEGQLSWALIGAYLTYPMYFWSLNNVFWTSLSSSTLFSWYSKKWKRKPTKPKPMWKRITVMAFCGLIYLSLWSTWFYFNCSITDKGEPIKCRDAAKNFMRSPIWQEFKGVMYDLYIYAQYHGWKEILRQLIQAFDPQGEKNALKVLNLTSEASQEDITAQYRKLSRKWHPDRQKTKEAKEISQEKFIEIQQAYEILSDLKAQRLSQNKKARPESQPDFLKNDEL